MFVGWYFGVVFSMEQTKAYLYCEKKEPEDSKSLRRRVREVMRLGAREIRRWNDRQIACIAPGSRFNFLAK